MKNLCFSSAILAIISAIGTPANAQIMVSGNVGAGGAAVFKIESDLTFSISGSGAVSALAFDEWVASDGNNTSASFAASSSLSYVLNGTPDTKPLGSLSDNFANTIHDITDNDGYFLLSNPITVVAGDTLTLKAGTWNFTGAASFNSHTVQTFTGNVFLTDVDGNRLSGSLAAVPEPGEYGLMAGAGLLGWAVWRRTVRPIAAS